MSTSCRQFLYLLIASFIFVSCSQDDSTSSKKPRALPPIVEEGKVNADDVLKKPIVVMISIDGFRPDYMEKYKPKTLLKLAAEGAHAVEGMKPSFPTLTFPNHVTLVTGKVPANHGIVSNFFYDEKRKAAYQMNDDNAVHDGSWYNAEPLWSVAEKSGMLSSVCFWVGSEAEIAGYRPNTVTPYKEAASLSSAQRADKIIGWLKLPEKKRPHFIALYYSQVDSDGHKYGPNSEQVQKSLSDIDASIGMIVDYADKAKLPVQFIIVSDHGMLEIKERINLGKLADFKDIRMMERGAVSQFYADDDSIAEATYQQLKAKEKNFKVYRRGQLPAHLNFFDPDRAGDFTVIGDPGYYLTVEAAFSLTAPDAARAAQATASTHGWDPETPEMRALFIARGPMIKRGLKIPTFENVHVYPLVLDILDLQNEYSIDGKHEVLKGILR